jgi:predicted dehydrogenase
MKLLVVGSGLIGAQRIQALTKLAAISEITVFDPKLAEGTRLSPKAAAANEKAAFSKKYDAAVVATPHDTAVQLLPNVFPLAPNVLVEKPLGRTGAETESLIAAAKKSGGRVFVGLNYRFLKNVQHLHRLLSSGEYGRVLGVDAVLSHGAQPGYIDPGIHLFDLFVWMFGGAELATGHLSRQFWQIRVEDHASLVLSLPGGAPASVNLSLSSWQSRLEITVETEKAQFFLRGRGKFYGAQRLTIVTKWPWTQPDQPRETQFDYGMEDVSLQQETEEFVTACTNPNAELAIATAADALQSMRIVDACYTRLAKTY